MCIACLDEEVHAKLDRQYHKYTARVKAVQSKIWRLYGQLLLGEDFSDASDDDCFAWSAWLHDVAVNAAIARLEQEQFELLNKFTEVRTAQLQSTCTEFWAANR